MGYRYGGSDNNEISIGLSIWNMVYRYGTRYIDMIIYHVDLVILDIDIGYGLMIIWEMTVSIWSSPVSIWDILSLWQGLARPPLPVGERKRLLEINVGHSNECCRICASYMRTPGIVNLSIPG
jgi:hypothetical protein